MRRFLAEKCWISFKASSPPPVTASLLGGFSILHSFPGSRKEYVPVLFPYHGALTSPKLRLKRKGLGKLSFGYEKCLLNCMGLLK